MIRIKYDEEIISDISTMKRSIVIVEMEEWKEVNNFMQATINYITQDIITGAEFVLKTKQITISTDKYNQLFMATDHLIPVDIMPFEKAILRKTECLLLFIKTDILEGTDRCIFNTEPQKWVKC